MLGKGNERRKILFILLRSVRSMAPLKSYTSENTPAVSLKPHCTFKRDFRWLFTSWPDTVKHSLPRNKQLFTTFIASKGCVPSASLGCFGCKCRQQNNDSKAQCSEESSSPLLGQLHGTPRKQKEKLDILIRPKTMFLFWFHTYFR